MADEITMKLAPSGQSTLYAVLQVGGQIVHASNGTRVANSNSAWPAAAIALSDSACPTCYCGSVPAGTSGGRYSVWICQRAGSSPQSGDAVIGSGTLDWDGQGEAVPLPAADGIPAPRWLKSMLAFFAGHSTVTDNGDGTYTVLFKAQDGSSNALSVTATAASGARGSTTIAM